MHYSINTVQIKFSILYVHLCLACDYLDIVFYFKLSYMIFINYVNNGCHDYCQYYCCHNCFILCVHVSCVLIKL